MAEAFGCGPDCGVLCDESEESGAGGNGQGGAREGVPCPLMKASCHGSEDDEDNNALVGEFEEWGEPRKRESREHERPDQLTEEEGKKDQASESAEQVEGGNKSDIAVSGKEEEASEGNPKDAKDVAERGVENGGGDIAIGGGRKGNGTGYGGREESQI